MVKLQGTLHEMRMARVKDLEECSVLGSLIGGFDAKLRYLGVI